MAKKPGLIYDNEGAIRAELLLAAAVDHEEQLRKAALFWAGVGIKLGHDDRSLISLIDAIGDGLTEMSNSFDALATAFEQRLPDDEEGEE